LPILLFLAAFLLTLLFYSLERLQFLLWNWSFYQSQPLSDIALAFIHALRFDLSALSILAALPFLIFWMVQVLIQKPLSLTGQRWLLAVFVLFQLPFMVMNLGDAEFVNFLGRRYTFDALFFLREIPGTFWAILTTYWLLNLINVSIMLAYSILTIYWLPKKLKLRPLPNWKKSFAFGFAILLAMTVTVRGGLQRKPINFAHAQIFLNPMMNTLVLNSAFTFLQTIKRQSLPRDKYFETDEMLKWVRHGSTGKSLLENARPKNPPNIVLIILESFALEYMGRPHQGEGYTPFLDELSKDSIFFFNAFANARRSIEGVGAIMGGIPALMNEPFISSQYLTNYFLGAGTWLQKKNYHTSFFHGAQNGSMYFDQFMGSAGVQNYYGLNEYPNPQDSDGTWGIWDEPFLQWMSGKLSTFPQPFFSTVFTLSSHHPFAIPAEHQGKFPKGTADIHETIGYTDDALKKFFETAKKEAWYENTIFFITADHTYKPHKPEYNNEIGLYRVPLMIYSPGIQLPKLDESQVVQHIDILPTILDLVGLEEKEKNYLGSSVFVPGDRFAISYTDGRYLFITESYFLAHARGGEFHLFSMQDPSQKTSLQEPNEKKVELENRLKAVIQYFSQGMWDNKLYYPSGR